MLPSLRHNCGAEEWKAICRLLVVGYKNLKCFPITLSKAFVITCDFGEKSLTADLLLDGLFAYIPFEEKEILKNTLGKEVLDIDGDGKEELETLDSLASKRVPKSGEELHSLLLELAHAEIVQKPSYVREAFQDITEASPIFKDIDEVQLVYNSCKPAPRKILLLLQGTPESDAEGQSFRFLKQFIRGLKKEDMPSFLRFTTGADMICINSIRVMFNQTYGFGRTPVVHTCGPVLEHSVNYESYAEFKEEFLSVLQSGYWNIDIV